MRNSLFITAEVLTRLVEGSYEALITRVQDLVEAEKTTIYGSISEDLEIRVSGTYACHAILISTDVLKPIVRLEFAARADGSLRLVKHEVVPVPTYDTHNTEEYVRVESRRAVDALLTGDFEGAQVRLRETLRYAEPTVVQNGEEFLARLREHMQTPRAWRAMTCGTKAPTVRAYLGERYAQVVSRQPQARYRTVCDESNVERRPSLGSLRTAVETLLGRLEAVTLVMLQAASRSTSKVEGAQTELASLATISEDLVRDVHGLRRLAKESCRVLDNVRNIAQVYDALADSLFEYEIAQAFIVSLVERLAA